MPEYSNALIHSTSPYLLQHAHNPVNWQEWNEETLTEAKIQNKPILVSIGYSSCHWCHVMEKESFEDAAIAKIMNDYFINIKVDREERPDVDQVYMDAVHAMGLRGGWPLNVFLTPDQKPFYGGTYFPKEGWRNLLLSIQDAFKNNRGKIDESAEAFTKNLQQDESKKYKLEGTDHKLERSEIDSTYKKLAKKFDSIDGGIQKAPKFPMPSVWQYLATHYYLTNDSNALNHLDFTLEKIANGGIYDHIGGGFARYSVDAEWHVPHFEKMLYDNGQLLSLYANAYKLKSNPKFKKVIEETVSWLTREMLDDSGGFYSALDADSEGEEGKFYVWNYDELKKLSGKDFEWIAEYYEVSENGNWEGKNVLRVVHDEDSLMKKYGLSKTDFYDALDQFKSKALKTRDQRIRPGLDNKIIAGWNGLTLTGLCHSYQALKDSSILELADQNASFIKNNLVAGNQLKRFPDKPMEAFLEDYSAVIQSFITYYETTLEFEYLELAEGLIQRVNESFYDQDEGLYYFTSDDSQELIARKKELFDNVIPSSNSIMAWNLIHLGKHIYSDDLVERGQKMIAKAMELIKQEPEYMSNWALLALEISIPFAEVIMIGPESKTFVSDINKRFLPNKIISGTSSISERPPFTEKTMIENQTTIYVCFDKACQLPVTSVDKAMNQIKE